MTNLATFLLRTDIRAIISSGWSWLYFLSFCFCVIYFVDVYARIKRWAKSMMNAVDKGLIALSEAAKVHESIMDTKAQAFDMQMVDQRNEWARRFAETVENVVQYKAGTADVAKLQRRLEAIENRLPTVGAT